MKKPKVLAKIKRKSSPSETPATASRVTNDSVSKHRDEILSKGRQFKYPFHRSKHRVAIVSMIVVVAAVFLLSAATGFQLYRRQSTSEFTQSVTSVLPFPVARVNGDFVPYESYLFELNSSVHWQEKYGTG
jgi:hypothetical protein